ALCAPSEKLTQIIGSAPTNSQNRQNSSIPTSLESRRPQTMFRKGVRRSRLPMLFFQRYLPGSTTDPPQRIIPALRSLISCTTSPRQPDLLSAGINETLSTHKLPSPSARISKAARSDSPTESNEHSFASHEGDNS